MKKLLALLLVASLLVCLSACGNKAEEPAEPQAEATEAVPEAPSGEVTFSLDVFDSDSTVEVTATLPESGWVADTNYAHIYNVPSLDDAYSDTPRVQIEVKKDTAGFDTYKDKFENLAELPPRTISGIEMTGRSYKDVGMDWNEYIGVLSDTAAVSIKTSGVDIGEGTEASAIIDSMVITVK